MKGRCGSGGTAGRPPPGGRRFDPVSHISEANTEEVFELQRPHHGEGLFRSCHIELTEGGDYHRVRKIPKPSNLHTWDGAERPENPVSSELGALGGSKLKRVISNCQLAGLESDMSPGEGLMQRLGIRRLFFGQNLQQHEPRGRGGRRSGIRGTTDAAKRGSRWRWWKIGRGRMLQSPYLQTECVTTGCKALCGAGE
ncbi:unnamed protein product [Pleuronectes platessa]|uniref:Uncharacterized protein n=1 Tax=Pleuronectes platessa TaxID=8262 RepID=A0A9N7TNS2_PLEPL|nr:unnamed protein product [Pleuronectes platessa]